MSKNRKKPSKIRKESSEMLKNWEKKVKMSKNNQNV